MVNRTSIVIPKKYKNMVETVEKDSEGYWAYSKRGYMFEGMGAHTAHEDNQKELLAMVRTLKKCECKECLTGE